MVTLTPNKVSDNLWHISKPSIYKDGERCSLWVYDQFRDFQNYLEKNYEVSNSLIQEIQIVIPLEWVWDYIGPIWHAAFASGKVLSLHSPGR